MKAKCRATMFAGLLGALAGCTTGDVVLEAPGAGYVEDAAALVAGLDWSRAQAVTVELEKFEFKPANLDFQAGRPYRLVLRNTGERTHSFVSEEFFKAIAAQKLVSASGEVANPYLKVIAVSEGETKELYFVPVRQGTYDLECSVFLHDIFGMEGQITIR